MSVSRRIIQNFVQSPSPHCRLSSRPFIFFFRSSPWDLSLTKTLRFHSLVLPSRSIMPQKFGGRREQRWIEKPKGQTSSRATKWDSESGSEALTNEIGGLSISESSRKINIQTSPMHHGNVQIASRGPSRDQQEIWQAKSYGTTSLATAAADREKVLFNTTSAEVHAKKLDMAEAGKSSVGSSKLLKGNFFESFTVDNSTYSLAQIRATFYPKFENEKSDQEIRTRMIEMVSKGLATVEVSLKHSGSLFMYAGHKGGAYAKNSFGNIYTAVGVFVLGRMFRAAWGTDAAKKQADFNDFLENSRMCISMELVTAVLGDHGQRPRDDYAVVTAVIEYANGKPKFYSTPEIIAFCRTWRLPTNHVWLFSTRGSIYNLSIFQPIIQGFNCLYLLQRRFRKSVTSFFAAFDALYEEGTATTVCNALDEVSDVSVPGSKNHIEVQGEILEGLVARIVTRDSSKQVEQVLKDHPPPPNDGHGLDLGPSLREICAANRSDEKQQIKALLQSVGSSFCPDHSDWFLNESDDTHTKDVDKSVLIKFLEAHPADLPTTKLQEMVRLMREKRLPAAFKCYHNFDKLDSISSDNIFYKMVIHVRSDSAFKRYQKEMRQNSDLWPLYRGFFVDINLFKASKEKAADIAINHNIVGNVNGDGRSLPVHGLADEDANLMIKLKFLTYKLRTFLIRNGLSILFKDGTGAYKAYYLRQMKIWGTSAAKQRELSKMLDEWAVYIRRKCGNKQLSSSIYLTEAESFLEQYAKRSPQNQVLIGSAGDLVRVEDFLAITEEGRDEEGDLETDKAMVSPSSSPSVKDTIQKKEGLIVFFPGIPGCAKSALCNELLKAPGGLGDLPVHSLMGDLIKGKYWQKVADERRRKPNSIVLADKNAPNEDVWKQIEDMCRGTRASAVPVVPDSEGTDLNPFSLEALAVFMFRVLGRVNHPGNLDKASQNAGYVLLMFYHLYDGKTRKEFESELIQRFGSLVKMPILKSDRSPLPDPVRSVLEEGINLFQLHSTRHGRKDSTKGSYAKEWAKWEKKLRDTLLGNAEYLNSIQVPFEFAVKQVSEQLKIIAKGDYTTPVIETKKLGSSIVFAAIDFPVSDIEGLFSTLAEKNPQAEAFLKDKHDSLKKAHVTLAHKRSHGVPAVASYGQFRDHKIPVEFNALLFTDKMGALEAQLGSVDGEKVVSRNEWPHVTIWTADGVPPKEANTLLKLVSEGKATRIEISPPITLEGVFKFY